MVIENFVEKYVEMKEKYLTDKEISKELLISGKTLSELKKVNGLGNYPRVYPKNRTGLSEDEIKKGLENGLTRRIMLRRVRDYLWCNEDAISKPKGFRFNHSLEVDKNERKDSKGDYRPKGGSFVGS